ARRASRCACYFVIGPISRTEAIAGLPACGHSSDGKDKVDVASMGSLPTTLPVVSPATMQPSVLSIRLYPLDVSVPAQSGAAGPLRSTLWATIVLARVT